MSAPALDRRPPARRPDADELARTVLPRRRRPARTTALTALVVAAVVVVHVLAWNGTEFSLVALVEGREGMARFIGESFPPDLDWTRVVRPGLEATVTTLWIGLLGTTLSVPFSLGLAVLAARTTTPAGVLFQVARAVLSFLRAEPDIVIALIFVPAVGLGPFS
ncbi:PhnE/PtxC family ABC transporter permease, partial [Cellulomonas sp. GbtcB1]|uniref:PhnE/PtxC family ABC transporter permease n=1 Tax=Cellulomonas sp. GbtcB1 TaxID=2824746 RepID=UPI0034D59A89